MVKITNWGCIPSDFDERDFLFKQIITEVPLPENFTREKECSPVRDQGKFGTCVSFASAGIKDWQEKKESGKDIVTSPLFHYTQCKAQDGKPSEEGTDLRTGCKVLQKNGICLEETMPYKDMSWPVLPVPCSEQIREAILYVIQSYARMYSLSEIKQAIYQSGPVLAGVFCTESFLEPVNGYIPMPEGDYLGGHAITLVGWSDKLKAVYADGKTKTGFLRIRNSWGNSWGQEGNAWLPYDFYYEKLDIGVPYFFEAWSMIDMVLPKPGNKEITLWIGKREALIDGVKVTLDQTPIVSSDTKRTLVPLRFVAENMGWKVEWCSLKKMITLRRIT